MPRKSQIKIQPTSIMPIQPMHEYPARLPLRAVDGTEDAYVDALDRMPVEFLDCRRSHLWEVIRDFHLVDCFEDADRSTRMGYSRYVEQVWKCTRCSMKRSDAFYMEKRGHRTALVKLGSSSYTPPPGYYVVDVPGSTAGRGELLRGLQFDRAMR
jgi:hypothetical protein